MIRTIFEWLSNSLQLNPIIALTASFIWGIFSILLSPCHLASIPLIVAFIGEQGKVSTKRAFWLATSFSMGILTTITAIGLITGLLGRMLGDIGSYGNYFVAIIFFVMGFHLLEIIQLPFLGKTNQPAFRKKGLWAAFGLGLIFGIALGPCTFAYMAPMLGIVFKLSAAQFFYGAALLFAYGIGHCSVIVFAGTSAGMVQKYLNWNERSKGAVLVKKICGILVILGGIYLIWSI
ncbi:MAG: cytochrome C biogenesis protein [Actinobacteria bacterium RBG_13_35_12]|uniref:Cytochrome C biogenesis protein n=1 Tax=Candidatus Sediminicultor quintus TaxID=1797291 RepID=A0A1F5AG76_9BACT|nr:MAG: cytochrome C biogenesis protein [Actinobacteria bacterium RBG_13_35_12]OGD16897.1 MAG: cytochrome C biogenesis protein [Candidatus Atribacteria bacterium RBG_19FT_COMBO_35_14]